MPAVGEPVRRFFALGPHSIGAELPASRKEVHTPTLARLCDVPQLSTATNVIIAKHAIP